MKSANGVGAVIDDCVDDSTRGRLVVALTDGLRRMLADGDGEGAMVVLRALDDVVRLAQEGCPPQAEGGKTVSDPMPDLDEGQGKLPNVTSIERARRRVPKGVKTGR